MEVFDESYFVKHIRITNREDIKLLCGSKYVQSDLSNVFTKVKEEIIPGLTVESLNAMIHNARSARGGFSHRCMNGRPVKKVEDEEETK